LTAVFIIKSYNHGMTLIFCSW